MNRISFNALLIFKLSVLSLQSLLVKIIALAFIEICLIIPNASYSQNASVGINNTGAAPNSKALLDIDATGMSPKSGVMIPRMTTADRKQLLHLFRNLYLFIIRTIIVLKDTMKILQCGFQLDVLVVVNHPLHQCL